MELVYGIAMSRILALKVMGSLFFLDGCIQILHILFIARSWRTLNIIATHFLHPTELKAVI
jgi:hypothetical protein